MVYFKKYFIIKIRERERGMTDVAVSYQIVSNWLKSIVVLIEKIIENINFLKKINMWNFYSIDLKKNHSKYNNNNN